MSELTRALSKKLPPNWTAKTLEEVVDISSGTTPLRTKQSLYFDGGTIPWVKTGDLNNGLIRTTEECITELARQECSSCTIYPSDTVLVAMYGGFKQIGRTGRLGVPAAINQALSALQIKNGDLSAAYLQIWLNGRVGLWKRLAASSRKDPNITGSDVAAFPIVLPPISEQRTIASILSAWDQAIELTEKLVAAKQKRKAAMVQVLLTGKVRLPGFTDGWGTQKAGSLFKAVSVKNHPGERVLSVTQDMGVVYRDEMDRKIGMSEENTGGYKLVVPGDFIISLRSFQGGLELSRVRGIVSPAYHVIRATVELDTEFFRHFFKSYEFIERLGVAIIGIRDGKQISYEDFSALLFRTPPLDEQKAIAAVLNTQEREIELLQKKLDALRRQKKGLMQQLLTGKVRVNVTGAVEE